MIPSKYNVVFEKGENIIVYNLLSMKLLKTDLITWDRVKSAEINASDDLCSFFSDGHEHTKVDYLFNCIKYQSSRISITLMITMTCNFSCTYCFESELNEPYEMTVDDSDTFINWLIKTVTYYRILEVDLCFHGGEPLLFPNTISHIATKLSMFFNKNNIGYIFSVVTNGFCLTPSVGKLLYNSGVSLAQITVDGPKKIHDQRRKLKCGTGSYDKILKNIKENQFLEIFMGIVFDIHNVNQIDKFIRDLSLLKFEKNISKINLNATLPIKKNNEIVRSGLTQIDEAKAKITLLKTVMDCGFNTNFELAHKLCSIRQKGSFVISPKLDIFTCISGICNPAFFQGHINDGDAFEMKYMQMSMGYDESCRHCDYYPVCIKNCLYENQITGKNVCRKIYWKYFIPEYINLLSIPKYKKLIIMPEDDKKRIKKEYSI